MTTTAELMGTRARGQDDPIDAIIQKLLQAGLQPPAREDITPFSDIKRFRQRWHADAKFRTAFPAAPRCVGEEFGLRIDPEIVRPLWDPQFAGCAAPPVLERYLKFRSAIVQREFGEIAAAMPSDPRFVRWRQRQIYRLNLELGVTLWPAAHIPASFELSSGCSVGCWFCSLSPPKLDAVFRYTPENARLWRAILAVILKVGGSAARRSICYSGTDPFDNPDYEYFAKDFASVMGKLPYMSTAIPLRDIERTRRMIAASAPFHMRFSILSLGMLSKVHAAFSPEEMLLVAVGLRNEGSTEARFMNFAGRARENVVTYGKFRAGDPLISTPSCETGFKFNMVERRIKLVSPCVPDDHWSQGHRIYDESKFDTGDDVGRVVEDMIERHMGATVNHLPVLRFHNLLRLEPTRDGFALVGPYLRQRFEATPDVPFMARLGKLIQSAKHTADAATVLLEKETGAARNSVTSALDELFRLGALDDDPREPSTSYRSQTRVKSYPRRK